MKSKTFLWVTCFLLGAAPHAIGSDRDPVAVSVFQDGKKQVFERKIQDRIVMLALELLRSADTENDQSVATEDRFTRAQQTAHLRLTFTQPVKVAFRFSGRFTTGPATLQTVEISELMIPISSTSFPDHIFVREREKIRAFAKYRAPQAQALQDVLKK